MKEPHGEGVANQADLESCAGGGDIAGEALIVALAGRLSSREILPGGDSYLVLAGHTRASRHSVLQNPVTVPHATLLTEGEGHIVRRDNASGARARRGRGNPGTPGNSLHENRETSATLCCSQQAGG
jgi:hypothetical protein